MQRFQEGNQCCYFRRAQVLTIGGHVTAALDYLSHKLIVRHPGCHPVERRTSLATRTADRMTITALFHLEDQRTLPFQWRASVQVFRWDRGSAPSVHHGTPRRIVGHASQYGKRNCHEQKSRHRNGSPLPTLLSLSRKERQQNQKTDYHDRANQKEWGF